MQNRIRVLIIDDSALIRELLTEILSKDPDIEVVGKAPDAYFAVDKVKKLNPDVITLDINMPKVNGLVFLENLMKSNPLPVIVISSLTEEGSETTVNALELGAVDFVSKPKSNLVSDFPLLSKEIIEKVKIAYSAKDKVIKKKKTVKSIVSKTIDEIPQTNKIIAIGSSTGGVEAITTFLKQMPKDIPPTIIVQHMPKKFVKPFAKRLNSYFPFMVKVAEDNEKMEVGKVLIAPGEKHVKIKNKSGVLIQLYDGQKINNHKPSVDILFNSIAAELGDTAIGIILTGMGRDGAKGLKAMKEKGAYTIAQSKDSCIIYGMPGEAVKIGAVENIVHINEMGKDIISHLS